MSVCVCVCVSVCECVTVDFSVECPNLCLISFLLNKENVTLTHL